MRERLFGKALLMLVIMLFYSVVLVPSAHCVAPYVIEGNVIRATFGGVAPSSIVAGTGGMLLRASAWGTVFYLLYKAGALDWMKNFWNNEQRYSQPTPSVTYTYAENSSKNYRVWYNINQPSSPYAVWWKLKTNPDQPQYWNQVAANTTWAWVVSYFNTNNVYSYLPNTPVPINNPIDISSHIPSNTLYASAGSLPIMASGDWVVENATIGLSPETEAAIINALNLRNIDLANGTQDGEPVTDEQSQAQQARALEEILSEAKKANQWLSQIKTNTDNISTGSFPQSAQDKLNQIAASSENTALLTSQELERLLEMKGLQENTVTTLQDVKRSLTETSADQSNLTSRINEIKTLAATKFPFSVVASVSVSVPSSGVYNFAPLPLGQGVEIPINPMNTPLSSFFTVFRSILVAVIWVGTIFAIIKKAMEM
jgi:hypothetical protein